MPRQMAGIGIGDNEKGLAGPEQRKASLPEADQAIPRDRLVSY